MSTHFSSLSVSSDLFPVRSLEFSVSSKEKAWEVKETLLREDDDDSPSGSGYGGGAGYGQGVYPPQKGGYGQYGY